jgi:hypothetical protein
MEEKWETDKDKIQANTKESKNDLALRSERN